MECKRSSWGKKNELLLPILRTSFCPKEAEVMYIDEMIRDPLLWTFSEEWNGQCFQFDQAKKATGKKCQN